MKHVRLAFSLPLLGVVLLGAAPGRPRVDVVAKSVDSLSILCVEHIGPYAQVDKRLREVAVFKKEHGLGGRLIAVYHDNPRSTATSALRSYVGVVLGAGDVNRLVRAFRPELEGKTEDIEKELMSEKGLELEDPFKIRQLEPRLVAASRVRVEFEDIPKYYAWMRDWIWDHNYYLIGPVVELYDSAPEADREVSAEIQLAIERGGVPDRR